MPKLFRKLPARSITFVLPLIISIFMSCMVSGVATAPSIGFPPEFLHVWMTAWAVSWIIAFPVLLVVMPTARRIAFLFVEKA